MKKKNEKILKWILIIGGIALLIYLISQSGDGNFFSVVMDTVKPSHSVGMGAGG